MKTLDLDLRDAGLYNAFINGNFDYWQRGATATYTQASSVSRYVADRVISGVSSGAAKGITINRSTQLPPNLSFQSQYSYEIVNNTAVASFVSTEYIEPMFSKIEGTIFANLYGKDFTIGFYLNAVLKIQDMFVILV
jgi:hypothetical protein